MMAKQTIQAVQEADAGAMDEDAADWGQTADEWADAAAGLQKPHKGKAGAGASQHDLERLSYICAAF